MKAHTEKSLLWDYNEKSDILNIRRSKKKTAGSAELGDFTVDFDAQGNVVGIEIINTADFFAAVKISREQLEHIKSAELVINQKNPQYTLILIKVLLPQNIERTIPIPAPVMAEVSS